RVVQERIAFFQKMSDRMKSHGIQHAVNYYEGEIRQLQNTESQIRQALEEMLARTELLGELA
ncbi:MAG: hypothetical protein VKL39_15865, partial [Leptolyngbyaceae bacterium]|nr:hypothetical protein [Leptolyngbyaceae bacterium]